MSHVLRDILSQAHDLHRQKQPCLAVFDLDSTLYDLRPRITEIIHDFAKEHAERWPRECQILKGVQLQRADWGLRAPLSRLGLIPESNMPLFETLVRYWRMHFFSNTYLHKDTPLPGAVEFVESLLQAGADIMYLTGRDQVRMLPGTEASLQKNGFPSGTARSRLLLKPLPDEDDAVFKVEVLKEELKRYQKIWFFENEPVNLRLTQQQLPEIDLVFIVSNHSGRDEPWPELKKVPHFLIDQDDDLKRSHSQ